MSVSHQSHAVAPHNQSADVNASDILDIVLRFGSVAIDVDGLCVVCGHLSAAFVLDHESDMICPDCDLPIAV